MSRQSQSGSFFSGSLPQCPQILPLGGPTQYTRTVLKPASRMMGPSQYRSHGAGLRRQGMTIDPREIGEKRLASVIGSRLIAAGMAGVRSGSAANIPVGAR